MNVKLLCEKSFSDDDEKIVDKFAEFQESLIEADVETLNEILLENFEFSQIPGKFQTKDEFILQISDGAYDFSSCEIMDPTILFDDGNNASLIAKVRLTAKVNGRELRWISNTVASFEKIDENWHLSKWDS